jgi:hypothetical protein
MAPLPDSESTHVAQRRDVFAKIPLVSINWLKPIDQAAAARRQRTARFG